MSQPFRHIRFWVWFPEVCYIIFDILDLPEALLVTRCAQQGLCGDRHIHGGSFPRPGSTQGPSAFAGCLSLDLGISSTQRQHTLGNANQRTAPTKVRSCTEPSVTQSSTVQASACWDSRAYMNLWLLQSQSCSSTWAAHHICIAHTLEISEKIQAPLQFQLKAAQAKTNVMISGLSELRVQQWELEWDQPPAMTPLLTEAAPSICSHRKLHPGQTGAGWQHQFPGLGDWTDAAWLYICEWVSAGWCAIAFVAEGKGTEIVKNL